MVAPDRAALSGPVALPKRLDRHPGKGAVMSTVVTFDLRLPLTTFAAAPLPVFGRCASCAPGRLALDYVPVLAPVVPVAGLSSLYRSAIPAPCH
jgi:hypothetical protein